MNSKTFDIKVESGAPAVAIPKEFHMAVGKVLNSLQAGGRARLLKRSEFEWTIWVDSFVGGTPGLFKVPVLLGVSRGSSEDEWQAMSINQMIEENPSTTREQAELQGSNTALELTFDYIRAVEL
jgi:hypothetical protein